MYDGGLPGLLQLDVYPGRLLDGLSHPHLRGEEVIVSNLLSAGGYPGRLPGGLRPGHVRGGHCPVLVPMGVGGHPRCPWSASHILVYGAEVVVVSSPPKLIRDASRAAFFRVMSGRPSLGSRPRGRPSWIPPVGLPHPRVRSGGRCCLIPDRGHLRRLLGGLCQGHVRLYGATVFRFLSLREAIPDAPRSASNILVLEAEVVVVSSLPEAIPDAFRAASVKVMIKAASPNCWACQNTPWAAKLISPVGLGFTGLGREVWPTFAGFTRFLFPDRQLFLSRSSRSTFSMF